MKKKSSLRQIICPRHKCNVEGLNIKMLTFKELCFLHFLHNWLFWEMFYIKS